MIERNGGSMEDTISREKTIKAMEDVDWYHINKDGQLTHGANSKEDEPLYKAKDVYAVLNTMPSAQPKKRTEERTETHACDLISRQAAIDALNKMKIYRPLDSDRYIISDCLNKIVNLPSAQPEPHWIPCSERMPKKNGFYLCTTKDCITILEFIEGNPHYHEESSFVSDVLGKCNSYVVAWMPLPEPYAERRTDGQAVSE